MASKTCSKEKFNCDLCWRTFAYKQSLNHHKSLKHGAESSYSVSRNIDCGICKQHFLSIVQLCDHVQKCHDKNLTIESLNFNSKAEYLSWKTNAETKGNFKFFQKTKKQNKNYLFCHRSGKYSIKPNDGNRISIQMFNYAYIYFWLST